VYPACAAGASTLALRLPWRGNVNEWEANDKTTQAGTGEPGASPTARACGRAVRTMAAPAVGPPPACGRV